MYWVDRDQWTQLEIISTTEHLAVWFSPSLIFENNLYVIGGKWSEDRELREKVLKKIGFTLGFTVMYEYVPP